MKNGTAQLRRNPISGSMAIIAAEREKKLETLQRKCPRNWDGYNKMIVDGEGCPFCPGHESMTPPEAMSYRDQNSQPNEPGWSVRVVPNKMPAVDQVVPRCHA